MKNPFKRRRNVAISLLPPAAADLPLPPERLRFMREDDERFVRQGDALVNQFDELTGLSGRRSIVDIGCGYGRVGHALLRSAVFNSSGAMYTGFDILPEHIRWCQQHLSPASGGRLRFEHVNVANGRYNPNGTIQPDEVTYPVPSGSADLVILTSVFTHMYPHEILHYFSEIRRMLSPEGRVYATIFLMNDRQRSQVNAYPLDHELNDFCRYMNADDPLHAIGYEQAWVESQLVEHGFRLVEPPRLGKWAGNTDGYDFQDTMLLALS